VDTSFDTPATVSIGITGTVSKYGPTSAWDLQAAAKTSFGYKPNEPAAGAESMIATYSAAGATVGAARILTTYVIPS
jgi:hypothetical protein